MKTFDLSSMESCTVSFLQAEFIPRLAPVTENWHVESCSEQILDRPLGGSGDSCVVARLTCSMLIWNKDDLNEQHNHGHTENHGTSKQPLKRRRTRSISYRRVGPSHSANLENRVMKFIVKRVVGPSSRYAEFDSLKTEIKRLSYKIEGDFLERISSVPNLSWLNRSISRCLYWSDNSAFTSLLIEEDLVEKGFPTHVGELDRQQAMVAIEWLARFHTSFRNQPIIAEDSNVCRIWTRGGYWSLDKRTEEYRKIRHRYKESLIDLEEQEQAFRDLPSNFALRLELSARALDALFYPQALAIPFSFEDERQAYLTQDTKEDEPDGRDAIRKSLTNRIGEQCLSVFPSQGASPERELRNRTKIHPLAMSTVIHGDFKAENIFFSSNITSCAVCDFQWIGYGLSVLDIVTVVCGSLLPEAESFKFIERLLDRYYDVYSDAMNLPTFRWYRNRGRNILGHLFDWALVDYSRFVVGSGVMFPEDVFFLLRAESILSRVDGGVPLRDHEAYNRAIRELMDRILYIE